MKTLNAGKLTLVICLLLSGLLEAKTSLWKVSHKGYELFIGGTIHALPAGTEMPSEFESAYQQSQQLVFEADLKKMQSSQFIEAMQQHAKLLPPNTLKSVLSPNAFALLKRYMDDNQLPPLLFEGLKPSIVALNITLLELQKIGYTAEGVDAIYFHKAFTDNKALRFLETPEFQLELMVSLGDSDPSSTISYTIEQANDYPQLMTNTLNAWRTGNTQLMRDTMIEPMKQQDDLLYQRLIVERNKMWVKQLTSLIKNPTTEFVLVGAAHLYGDDSVIALLQQQGFFVEQVK